MPFVPVTGVYTVRIPAIPGPSGSPTIYHALERPVLSQTQIRIARFYAYAGLLTAQQRSFVITPIITEHLPIWRQPKRLPSSTYGVSDTSLWGALIMSTMC